MKKTFFIALFSVALTAIVTFAIGPEGGLPEPLSSEIGQFISRRFYIVFLALGIAYSIFSPLDPKEPRWSRIGFVFAVVATCLLLEQTLDHFIWEPRPGWVNVVGKSSGFPSGHSIGSFAMASVLALLHRNSFLGIFAFFCAVLVGYSRVEVAAHYPHQVVAGAIIGTLIAFWILGFRDIWLQNRTKNANDLALSQTA